MNINLITANQLKFDIARAYFEPLGGEFELKQFAIETPEYQDISVAVVAEQSALWAVEQVGEPCIKSDAGLYIEALNGFPGPFLKYVNDWLGQDGYIRLLHGARSRRAYFQDALAIAFPDGTTKTFVRQKWGVIADHPSANAAGWPANELFIPDGMARPLGALTHDEQVAFWGEGKWPELVDYLRHHL